MCSYITLNSSFCFVSTVPKYLQNITVDPWFLPSQTELAFFSLCLSQAVLCSCLYCWCCSLTPRALHYGSVQWSSHCLIHTSFIIIFIFFFLILSLSDGICLQMLSEHLFFRHTNSLKMNILRFPLLLHPDILGINTCHMSFLLNFFPYRQTKFLFPVRMMAILLIFCGYYISSLT